MYTEEPMDCTSEECSRKGDGFACEGELVTRVSRSGLTVSTMCEGHMWSLEESLDAIQTRGLLDAVFARLADQALLDSDDLQESLEQMRAGQGKVVRRRPQTDA